MKRFRNTLYITIEDAWVHKDGETIISIRGSNNLKNWLRNFDIGRLQLAQGRVHGGFLKNAEKLYKHIKDHIDYRDKIYVTGHSLGGALAMLIAFNCAREFALTLSFNSKIILLISCIR